MSEFDRLFVCVVCGAPESYNKVCCNCSSEILKTPSGRVACYCVYCNFFTRNISDFGPNIRIRLQTSDVFVNLLIFRYGCILGKCPRSKHVNLSRVVHILHNRRLLASSLERSRQYMGK